MGNVTEPREDFICCLISLPKTDETDPEVEVYNSLLARQHVKQCLLMSITEKCMQKTNRECRNRQECCKTECRNEMRRQPRYHDMLIAKASKNFAAAQLKEEAIKKAAEATEKRRLDAIHQEYNAAIQAKEDQKKTAQERVDSVTQIIEKLTEQLKKAQEDKTTYEEALETLEEEFNTWKEQTG